MANETIIRAARRKLGLERRRARLGDGAGRVYVPGRDGYVYVRFTASADNTNSLTTATVARLRVNIAATNDLAVIVATDYDGVLAVIETDFQALEQSGTNPLGALVNNSEVNGDVDLNRSPILRCQPVGGSEPLKVSVLPLMYVSGTTLHRFAGEKVDLTASIPAVAAEWCLAGLFLRTTDIIEVITSTAQSTSDPLDETDIQECLSGTSSLSIVGSFYKLTNGQTSIADTDNFWDGRQWINIPSAGGSSTTFTDDEIREQIWIGTV